MDDPEFYEYLRLFEPHLTQLRSLTPIEQRQYILEQLVRPFPPTESDFQRIRESRASHAQNLLFFTERQVELLLEKTRRQRGGFLSFFTRRRDPELERELHDAIRVRDARRAELRRIQTSPITEEDWVNYRIQELWHMWQDIQHELQIHGDNWREWTNVADEPEDDDPFLDFLNSHINQQYERGLRDVQHSHPSRVVNVNPPEECWICGEEGKTEFAECPVCKKRVCTECFSKLYPRECPFCRSPSLGQSPDPSRSPSPTPSR